ncbi:hypothetical protein JXL19_00460 [bacterium]|nr:hypothetical protein [bacterium]
MDKKRVFLLVSGVIILFFLFYLIFQTRWSILFSPGELSNAHAEFDESGECRACHTRGSRLDNGKCLDCHDEIKDALQKEYGLHGRASSECSQCHSEHHGREYKLSYLDTETFDHATTGWALDGVHELLKCEACHSKDSYLLDMHECVLCHDDVHMGQLGPECHRCHDAKSFNTETYTHQTDKAPKGKHLQWSCDECHKMESGNYPLGKGVAVRYTGLDFTCNKCHEDVHDGEYGKDCAECHNQDTFKKE